MTEIAQWAASFPQAPALSVCIPTRDRLDLLLPCLRSLARTAAPALIEVVLGDGGSHEGTLATCAALGLRSVDVPGTFNFSRACNVMAEAARGRTLLFLNNDTEAHSNGWAERVVDSTASAIVTAHLIYPGTRRVQSAGITAVRRRPFWQPDAYRPRRPGRGPRVALQNTALGCQLRALPRGPVPVMAASGAFLAIAADRFDQLGGFDEAYLVDLQDVDLCLCSRAHGGEVICRGDIVFGHRHAGSRGRYRFPEPDWQRLTDRWGDELLSWSTSGPVEAGSRAGTGGRAGESRV